MQQQNLQGCFDYRFHFCKGEERLLNQVEM